MVRFLPHSEIDKSKWDAAIENAQNRLIYAFSWYLDVVCPGWAALIEEDYQQIMPLPIRRKWGFRYVFPPMYCQQLGVFSSKVILPQTIQQFLAAIPDQFRYIHYTLNHFNLIHDNLPNGFLMKPAVNYLIDLNKPYSEQLPLFDKNHKRNILKAEKQNLKFSKGVSVQQVVDLFLTDQDRKYHSVTQKDIELLVKLTAVLQNHECLHVYGVKTADGSQLLAGALISEHKGRMYFLFSGNSPKGREYYAMFFLVNELMKISSEKEKILDMEGSNILSLGRFYKGFGAKLANYSVISNNRFAFPISWLVNIRFNVPSSPKKLLPDPRSPN